MSFLPGESPWTEKPGGLQSIRFQRVRHLGELALTGENDRELHSLGIISYLDVLTALGYYASLYNLDVSFIKR